ncbi:enoyl-CoA hydratase-related protein [Allomesorhizobium camelthorni]|uniref:Crotonase n=1 Tax=Allomesorhizobium camelthorni TaxID=475069 RepID=A0A6G4WJA4_9HYPH|nr:crotonase [Mesorhizobium camelthorni]
MTVTLDIADRVARIVIDRPERLNAIDAEAETELEAIWQELERRNDVSCVVLTGAGEKAFCVGADLKDVSKSGLEYWTAARPNGFGGIAYRRSLDIPLIARVNGYALGGGFEMVLGCDIVIASETARFGLPEARVGRMPLDGGMVLLQRKIPHNLAMGVMLSGRRFSAAEMAGFGIVNEVAAPDALDFVVDRWADDIVACAPLSLRAIKQTVNRTGHLSPADAQALRTPALVAALTSEDGKEGVRAFNEKRAPIWQGR